MKFPTEIACDIAEINITQGWRYAYLRLDAIADHPKYDLSCATALRKIDSNLAHSNEIISSITELIKSQFLLEDSIE